MSIDDFVLEKSKDVKDRYDSYIDHLLADHPDVYIARYEDMVEDVENWLNNLLSYVDLSPPEALYTAIIEEANAIQGGDEDVESHYRKGQAGDHREKLSPSTIEELNRRFSRVFETFGYER
jgi:hypothetical protein